MHSLVRCANMPTTSPAISEIASGACIAPGPSLLNARSAGNAHRITSSTTVIAGIATPSVSPSGTDFLSVKPFLRYTIPPRIPQKNPIRPMIAFQSPPAILRIILSGQPRNMRAPTMTKNESTNLVIGDEPPRTLNSFPQTDIINAPRISPIISGRAYCTTGAVWSLRAPVVSLKKQAIQKPMLAGLPYLTRSTAAAPTTSPVMIIRVLFSFFIVSSLFK